MRKYFIEWSIDGRYRIFVVDEDDLDNYDVKRSTLVEGYADGFDDVLSYGWQVFTFRAARNGSKEHICVNDGEILTKRVIPIVNPHPKGAGWTVAYCSPGSIYPIVPGEFRHSAQLHPSPEAALSYARDTWHPNYFDDDKSMPRVHYASSDKPTYLGVYLVEQITMPGASHILHTVQ